MTFSTFLKIIIRRHFRFIIIILIVFLAIVGGYFYTSSTYYKSSDSIAESEAKMLTEQVGKLAFLPTDEVPTVAKVSNPELLKGQTFFKDAKRGDVVLIYSNAKKAILYDPVANKIVNMSVLNVGAVKKTTPTISDLKDTKSLEPGGETQF